MIVIDVAQGSEDWRTARLGLPTASNVDKLITPKTLKPSSQAATYRNQLLAEWLLRMPLDWAGSSEWMERGKELEAEAADWYALQHDVEPEPVGLVLRDDGKFGGSPDRLLGAAGGLEVKCPALHTHIGYLLDPQALADAYRGQVQAYLMLTGRAWWDLLAYNPQLPAVTVRIEPDPAYAAALTAALDAFLLDLEAARARLEQYRSPEPLAEAA